MLGRILPDVIDEAEKRKISASCLVGLLGIAVAGITGVVGIAVEKEKPEIRSRFLNKFIDYMGRFEARVNRIGKYNDPETRIGGYNY